MLQGSSLPPGVHDGLHSLGVCTLLCGTLSVLDDAIVEELVGQLVVQVFELPSSAFGTTDHRLVQAAPHVELQGEVAP